jgi:cysteinyl-tRNA synthetase
MTSAHYRQALEKARRDLAYAIQQRDSWNLRIVQAQNAVRSMAAMTANAEMAEHEEQEMQKQIGIAQAIEALVNGATQPLTPAEVREGLLFYGYDIDRYANPVSMIHQTLHRLAQAGRIREANGQYTRSAFYQALLNTQVRK